MFCPNDDDEEETGFHAFHWESASSFRNLRLLVFMLCAILSYCIENIASRQINGRQVGAATMCPPQGVSTRERGLAPQRARRKEVHITLKTTGLMFVTWEIVPFSSEIRQL